MATVKKGLGILALLFITRTIMSCCYCGEAVRFYEIEGATTFNLDNSGAEYFVSTSPIPKEAYGISIEFKPSYISQCDQSAKFFSAAYACDCSSREVSADAITSLRITTVNDFDSEHLAGSEVTAFFQVRTSYYEKLYTPIEDYLAPSVLIGSNPRIDLFLLTPPEAQGNYSFNLSIEFNDGQILNLATDEVTLE